MVKIIYENFNDTKWEKEDKEDILEAFKKFEDVIKDIKLEKVDWHMMYNVSNFIKLFNNISLRFPPVIFLLSYAFSVKRINSPIEEYF